MATTTRTITIPTELDPVSVLGPVDEVIREMERAFPELEFTVRGNRVIITSRSKQTESDASKAEHLIDVIVDAAHTMPMDAETVRRMIEQDDALDNRTRATHPGHGKAVENLKRMEDAETRVNRERRKPSVPGVITYATGNPVRAKTAGQAAYVTAIESHTITFGIGPAGTGKTYLAVAKAVRAFQDKQVRHIILTRPAVDIEVAPLAYMRGRTLNDAFVILDEAQNTTEEQMKMFLTRLGFNTKMVITGDITQVDLAVPRSGLATIERILGGIEDIAFVHLQAEDVVRHRLVGRIVAAYNRHDGLDGDHRRMSHATARARRNENVRQNKDEGSDER